MTKVLLGFHGESAIECYGRSARHCGYEVDIVQNLSDMLHLILTGEHGYYLMDANLGRPNTGNVAPAVEVYALLKERVEAGLAKFMALSCNRDAVENARQENIPAEDKYVFDFMKFMQPLEARLGQQH